MSPPPTITPAKLLSRFDESATPPRPDGSSVVDFAKLVSSILQQAAPTFPRDVIERDLQKFFNDNHISTEDGLGEFSEDSHLPPRPSDDNNQSSCIWKVMLLRNAFLTICKCSSTHYLQSTTRFTDCKSTVLASTATLSLPSPSTIAKPSDPEFKYSLKAVSSLSLDKFSGKFGTYKDWSDSVLLQLRQCGHKQFLLDEELCNTNVEISESIKSALEMALLDGVASHLSACPENKAMKNAAKFWATIKEKYDIQADRDCRELHQWRGLMDLCLEDRDKCDHFINEYETTLSYLQHSNSTAVKDKNLMRSMIIRGIQCPELDEFCESIIDDNSLKIDDIISKLRAKSIAFDSKKEISGTTTGDASGLKIRRGTTSHSNKESGSSLTKNTRIPEFPPGLRSSVPNNVWNTLCLWRQLHNKPILSQGEQAKLKSISLVDDGNTNNNKNDKRNSTRGGYDKYDRDRRNDKYNRNKRKYSRSRSRSRSPPGRRYGRSSRADRYDNDYKRRSRRARFENSDSDSDRYYSDNDYDRRSRRALRDYDERDNGGGRRHDDRRNDNDGSYPNGNNPARNTSQSAKSILTNGRGRN